MPYHTITFQAIEDYEVEPINEMMEYMLREIAADEDLSTKVLPLPMGRTLLLRVPNPDHEEEVWDKVWNEIHVYHGEMEFTWEMGVCSEERNPLPGFFKGIGFYPEEETSPLNRRLNT